MPDRLVHLVALVLPWVELLAGGLLVAGLLTLFDAWLTFATEARWDWWPAS
ncbi:MAG: hypothetical protein HY319_12585 [Armatimonadetes bacterium]|nr:hypothetical protein [Armatimonadota bacterium]